jgi:hypothetical protein
MNDPYVNANHESEAIPQLLVGTQFMITSLAMSVNVRDQPNGSVHGDSYLRMWGKSL